MTWHRPRGRCSYRRAQPDNALSGAAASGAAMSDSLEREVHALRSEIRALRQAVACLTSVTACSQGAAYAWCPWPPWPPECSHESWSEWDSTTTTAPF